MLTAPELAKLEKLEQLLEPCRHVTELLGGEQYVSCSVVLPGLCHLSRVMKSSDDDPIYVVKFKDTFTGDLANRKENTNLKMLKIVTVSEPRFKDLKCLPKAERDSEEEEEESIDKALGCYRAEPKLRMGDCPLNWWSGRHYTYKAYRNNKETSINPSYHSAVISPTVHIVTTPPPPP